MCGGDRVRTAASASDTVDASVLIPVLNEADHLPTTLAMLGAQRFGGRLEFLFIDGRSSDATLALLREAATHDSRIRVLDNPRRGIPFALNIGLAAARGLYVVRMDAHTVYPPDYVANGIARLERGDVDWVSGPQVPVGFDRGSTIIARALRSRLGVGGASFRRVRDEAETDTGYTGVIRRETLEQHAGWDEDWAVNEDSELAARVRKAGGRIVTIPEMAADYAPRAKFTGLARQYWRYGQFRAKTSRRHPESMRRSHVLPPALVLVAPLSTRPLGSPTGRSARLALMIYLLAVLGTALTRGRDGERPGVALALLVMHLSWGAGFLVGCARFGVPLAGLSLLVRSNGRT